MFVFFLLFIIRSLTPHLHNQITKFGGDPNHVTIWGVSAGAGSVVQHLIANGGNTHPPLFKNAITSSIYLPSQYNWFDPIPEVGRFILRYMFCLILGL
jgi:acetyl esterase/lipase